MMPLLSESTRAADASGIIGRAFHRWLQLVARALHGPFIGQKATGSFVIKDGEYGLHADELILHGNESMTLEGDAVLVIL